MKPTTRKAGRPKTKGDLRNFRFIRPVDKFLADEKTRTSREMTQIAEASLSAFMRLKPSARDAEYLTYAKEAA